MDRPTALPVCVAALPPALTARPRWVGWRYHHGAGRWAKVPVDCRTGRPASVTAPATWAPFPDAVAALARRSGRRPDGVGFVFAAGDGLVGVDLDDCRDPATGAVAPWARAVVRDLDTYAEVSPSGTGVKLVLAGALPPGGRRRDGPVEVYDAGRFFTLTGHLVPGAPGDIRDRHGAFLAFYHRALPPADPSGPTDPGPVAAFPGAGLTDPEVVDLLRTGPTGGRFLALWTGAWAGRYKSQSEADLALCGDLARAVGPDPGRIARLFAESRLAARPKWADDRGGYRGRTIARAIRGLGAARPGPGRLTMTSQDHADRSGYTHASDAPGEGGGSPARPDGAVAAAEALGLEHKQGILGRPADDFEASFLLARRLKNYAPFPAAVEPAVRAYCRAAGRPFDAFWVHVLDCWPRVEVAEGDGDWEWAVRQAVDHTREVLPGLGRAVNVAASLAYYLSTRTDPFFLPVEKVAAVVGMSAMMGTKLVRLLEREGVIRRTREYDRHQRQAREYTLVRREAAAVPASSCFGRSADGRDAVGGR